MKLSQTSGIYFYFYTLVMICGWNVPMQASQDNRCLSYLQTTQNAINNLRIDLEGYEYGQDIPDRDFIVEITVILIEMYEKIVSATVVYILMMHNPMLQQNLRDEVARIIARDMVKIFAILSRELTCFIFSQKMNVQEKIARCCVIAAIIVIIKLGIDQISFENKQNNITNNYVFSKEESGYLSDKFGAYR